MNRNSNFAAIAENAVKLMEDPSWLESADVFKYSAAELVPKAEFVVPGEDERP